MTGIIAGILSYQSLINPIYATEDNLKITDYDTPLILEQKIISDKIYDQRNIKFNIDLTNYKKQDLRKKIIDDTLNLKNAYLFGKTLDTIESKIKEQIDICKSNNKQVCETEYIIPENFLVKEMDIEIKIDKKEISAKVYQKYNGEEILLAYFPVAIGGKNKDYKLKKIRDFETPSGEFYLQRVVKNPFYYPPLWDKNTKKVYPGKNNPYGLFMSELASKDEKGDYLFKPKSDFDGVRIHSTNRPNSMGKKASHGCVRVHPDMAEELFPFLLHYTPHLEMKKNIRGEIIPFEKNIKVIIE